MKKYGICKICKKYEKLTFEHIPPKSAFNADPIRIYSVNDSLKTITDSNIKPWDFSEVEYKLEQKGNGYYSLCENCNSKTGAYYVNHYQMIAHAFVAFMANTFDSNQEEIDVVAENIKPLLFLKQILTMFASITNICDDEDMKTFILEKENSIFNSNKYKVYMSIFGGGIRRISGWSVFHYNNENYLISEIVAVPFIFVLLGNVDKIKNNQLQNIIKGFDITSFCKYKYNDEIEIPLTLSINECNTIMPINYSKKSDLE